MSRLATIGYEGATLAALIARLQADAVATLIDVRAVPRSRKPGFSKLQLAAGLEAAGIRYVGLRGLGTPPEGRAAARRGDTARMRAIFDAHMATDPAQADLALARVISREAAACLLCFERDPQQCHRLPVAQAIAAATGAAITHLVCDIPPADQTGEPAWT